MRESQTAYSEGSVENKKTQQNGLSTNGYGIYRRKEKKSVWKEERFVTSHSIKWGEMRENRVLFGAISRESKSLSFNSLSEHHRGRFLVALVTSCRFKSFDWLQFSSCFVYHEKWRQKKSFLCVEIKDNWNLWTLAKKSFVLLFTVQGSPHVLEVNISYLFYSPLWRFICLYGFDPWLLIDGYLAIIRDSWWIDTKIKHIDIVN